MVPRDFNSHLVLALMGNTAAWMYGVCVFKIMFS